MERTTSASEARAETSLTSGPPAAATRTAAAEFQATRADASLVSPAADTVSSAPPAVSGGDPACWLGAHVTVRAAQPFTPREWPEFAWSESKARLLRRCPAAYRLATYAKWNGWAADATPEARTAYVCSKLTSVPLVLGQAVHAVAERRVRDVMAGRRLATERQMRDAISATLNDAYLASKSQRQAFIANPTRVPMLAEIFWREGISAGIAADIRRKAAACAESLARSSIFPALADVRADQVLAVDTRTAFVVDGVTAYGAPDLVYQSTRHQGPDNRVEGCSVRVIDWKTGTADGVVDQVATYAALIAGAWGMHPDRVTFHGAVVPLGESGEPESCFLSARDLSDAVTRIHASVREMRALCADPDANVPKPAEAFPPRPGSHCRTCAFRGICPSARGVAPRSRATTVT